SRAGIGERVGRPVRVPHPADAGVARGGRRDRAPRLTHARGDVIQVEGGPDRGRAAVLIALSELTPLVEHLMLVRERVALVVHQNRRVVDPFAYLAAPVLQLLVVLALALAAAVLLLAV